MENPNPSIPQDMQDDLKQFNHDAESIARPFKETLAVCNTPALLYHYTNDAGLRGILETGQLWLSDIFGLNDPSELKHGFSHMVNILRAKAEKESPQTKDFVQKFEAFLHEGGVEESAHYFVCSFSSNGDDLGQWRAYADNGRGYALGFDGKALEEALTRKNHETEIPNGQAFPIIYDGSWLEDLHRQMIDKMFRLISLPQGRNLPAAAIREYLRDLSSWLAVHALGVAIYFKHEAYKNESEYRFLEVFPADRVPPDLKRRTRSYQLVRYREFDWRRLQPEALRRVVVGPAADREKARRFAKDCLAEWNLDGVEVECSDIPYRAV